MADLQQGSASSQQAGSALGFGGRDCASPAWQLYVDLLGWSSLLRAMRGGA
jgi:hypothetical protein